MTGWAESDIIETEWDRPSVDILQDLALIEKKIFENLGIPKNLLEPETPSNSYVEKYRCTTCGDYDPSIRLRKCKRCRERTMSYYIDNIPIETLPKDIRHYHIEGFDDIKHLINGIKQCTQPVDPRIVVSREFPVEMPIEALATGVSHGYVKHSFGQNNNVATVMLRSAKEAVGHCFHWVRGEVSRREAPISIMNASEPKWSCRLDARNSLYILTLKVMFIFSREEALKERQRQLLDAIKANEKAQAEKEARIASLAKEFERVRPNSDRFDEPVRVVLSLDDL